MSNFIFSMRQEVDLCSKGAQELLSEKRDTF